MNKTTKTVWWIVGIVVVVGLVWWGISRNGVSGNTVKIGIMLPLTGDAATYGEPMDNVIRLAANEINAQGGINGKPIELLIEDSKCDGTAAVNAAQKLINVDGVRVIAGEMCSGETLPIVPIAEKAKVVVLSGGASSPKLTGISPYFFRDYPSDSAQGKILADEAYNVKHWKTVAFMQEQTDYASGIYSVFNSEFQSLGGKTLNQSFQTSATDFRSMLVSLKAQNPDALFIDTQTPQQVDRVLKQLQELGWKLPLIINDATAGDPATLKADASLLEGTITAVFGVDPTNQKFEHLLSAYKAQYGIDVIEQGYAQTMYDELYLLVDGIKQVGYNGTALAKWSRTINGWQGASGAITIDANGDRVGGDTLEVVHNGVAQPLQ
jgi:branched-chain amino acid transport system substrate-binding protein